MKKKRIIEFIFVCFCLVVFVSGAVACSFFFPTSKIPTTELSDKVVQEETMLTIMDYNIRTISDKDKGNTNYYTRYPKMASQVKGFNPDLIGMQEVTLPQYLLLKESFSQDYGIIAVGRDNTIGTELNPVLYKLSRFELISADTFWLSETPDIVSKVASSSNYRICTYAILRDKVTNKTLGFYNTHLDHRSDEARLFGAKVIINQMTKEYPTILVGDMNCIEGSKPYKHFAASLSDCQYLAKDVHVTSTFNSYKLSNLEYPQANPKPIDFCFLSKNNFDVSSYRVINELVDGIFASDHFPIVVKLTVL